MSIALPCGAMIERDVVLAPFTSWVVGGPADFLAQPKTVDELMQALAWGFLKELPITVLGGGTNVLIADRGVRGLTISLRKMAGLKVVSSSGRLVLDCLAGTSKSELLKTFLKHRMEPALFLAGLPGDVGGGVVMNAGVAEMLRPREFVEITDWVEVLRWDSDDVSKTLKCSESSDEPTLAPSHEQILSLASSFRLEKIASSSLHWSYRHCEGWRPGIITRVGISWPMEIKDDILTRVKQANQTRLGKQPLDMPSCGSVFVNPQSHKSGQLVERSGLKGYAVGGAKVFEKHANFIVNFNKATASDIHSVIQHVRSTVKAKTGVELRTEVVYIGDWQSI